MNQNPSFTVAAPLCTAGSQIQICCCLPITYKGKFNDDLRW
jgi:hypothetical protein